MYLDSRALRGSLKHYAECSKTRYQLIALYVKTLRSYLLFWEKVQALYKRWNLWYISDWLQQVFAIYESCGRLLSWIDWQLTCGIQFFCQIWYNCIIWMILTFWRCWWPNALCSWNLEDEDKNYLRESFMGRILVSWRQFWCHETILVSWRQFWSWWWLFFTANL